MYTMKQQTQCARSENTSPFERLYTQANTQRMKLEMSRRRQQLEEQMNNTFHPNTNKQSHSTIESQDHTAMLNMQAPATQANAERQQTVLSLDTYKKVYRCNVDNLLKKYALGSQITKLSQKQRQTLKETQA